MDEQSAQPHPKPHTSTEQQPAIDNVFYKESTNHPYNDNNATHAADNNPQADHPKPSNKQPQTTEKADYYQTQLPLFKPISMKLDFG